MQKVPDVSIMTDLVRIHERVNPLDAERTGISIRARILWILGVGGAGKNDDYKMPVDESETSHLKNFSSTSASQINAQMIFFFFLMVNFTRELLSVLLFMDCCQC